VCARARVHTLNMEYFYNIFKLKVIEHTDENQDTAIGRKFDGTEIFMRGQSLSQGNKCVHINILWQKVKTSWRVRHLINYIHEVQDIHVTFYT